MTINVNHLRLKNEEFFSMTTTLPRQIVTRSVRLQKQINSNDNIVKIISIAIEKKTNKYAKNRWTYVTDKKMKIILEVNFN